MTTETVTDAATKRTAQVNAIRDFAVWLDRNPAVLVPELSLHRHMHHVDGTDAENLATVRSLAASLDVGTDESLDDRTVLRVKVNKHVYYELFAWHKGGRGDVGELERLRAELDRLRAEVAELRAAVSAGDLAGDTGLMHSREPESTVAAPVPDHVEGHPEGRAAVPPPGVLKVADGHVVHECCGKLDDAPHQNFCKHYEAPGLIVGDTAAEQRDNAYAAYERDEQQTGWSDEATGLVSGGLVPNCPTCGGDHHTVEPCR